MSVCLWRSGRGRDVSESYCMEDVLHFGGTNVNKTSLHAVQWLAALTAFQNVHAAPLKSRFLGLPPRMLIRYLQMDQHLWRPCWEP